MSNPAHAVVLARHACPPELIALLQNYIYTHDPNMMFLLCTEVEPMGHFLRCYLMQNESKKLGWVQIPMGCVAAIAELSEGKVPPGFLGSSQ
jgi:hypothetical protein